MKRYTLENKPKFAYGELVQVDMSCLGMTPPFENGGIETGKIVGKSADHIIDQWLVEFSHDFSPTYPYRVVSVQHTFIVCKWLESGWYDVPESDKSWYGDGMIGKQ